jgi:LysM repeat protein
MRGMIRKVFFQLIIAGFFVLNSHGQNLTPEQYIELYKDIAIREMKRMGIPAAITLAQGLLETENGNSTLVKKSNNHFGIKCKSNWTAGGVSHDDDAPGECFRTYKDADDSYRDHSNFLRGSERYAFLFSLDPSDYKAWAHGLKKAGYATNPKYPSILIKSIERYNLQQYTIAAVNEVPKFESNKFKDDPVAFDVNEKMQADDKEEARQQSSLNQEGVPETDGKDLIAEGKVDYLNGNKCVFAKKGTSLLAIATQHNVNLRRLLDYNDMEEDGILDEDQLIFLQKKSTLGEKEYYITRQKESYYSVAQKNGVQLQSVFDYNQVNEDTELNPGTKVYLKPAAETSYAKLVQYSAGKTKLYEVKPKEGLYTIARKNNVTVQQLREWNNLTSDELKIGQQLIVGK